MKTILICIICLHLFNSSDLLAQHSTPHSPAPPPINTYNTFRRGLFIDCAGDIIHDLANGNILGLEQQLTLYLQNNYINYIVLCDLEQANVFGNPVMEDALHTFLTNAKNSIPGIKIGLSGNINSFITPTAFLKSDIDRKCLPFGSITSSPDLKNLISNTGGTVTGMKAAETCKFFFRAGKFNDDCKPPKTSGKCFSSFDALYLEDRFWNQTTSLIAMQNEFMHFKNILSFMQLLKCNFSGIENIDAEFLPTDFYKLQGWTAIDQITEADPLIDRVMIPAFTYDASGVYNLICKTMHYLSDRFSKPRTEIFVSLNAESPAYNYCNSSLIPGDYLGNYLNGTTTPSGNMYSVEKVFLAKFNDSLYMCSACSCKPFNDDHYSATNPFANILSGSMWRPYSMMLSNNLTRKNNSSDPIDEVAILIEIYDIDGRLIKRYDPANFNNVNIENQLRPNEIFLKRTTFKNGRVANEKMLIIRD